MNNKITLAKNEIISKSKNLLKNPTVDKSKEFIKKNKKIIFIGVLVILSIIGTYFAFKFFKKQYNLGKLVLKIDELKGNDSNVIPGCEIKNPLDGFNFSIVINLYIDNYYENYSFWRHLFHKGSPVNHQIIDYEYDNILYDGWCDLVSRFDKQSPGLWLHPTINNLRFAINTQKNDDSKLMYKNHPDLNNNITDIKLHTIHMNECNNIEYCDLENVPVDTLVNIIFIVNDKNISIYMDGKLIKICNLMGIPDFNSGPMYFNYERSSDSYIKKFKYFPYVINNKEIKYFSKI